MRELVKNISKQNKPANFQIVPMLEDDIEAVKKLEIHCNLSPWSIEDYKNELSRNDSLTIVAKIGGKVVGFALARLITNFHDKKLTESFKEVEIYNIAVKPTAQNSGIGQSLLDRLLSDGTARGATKFWLEVRESNDVAIRFYKKNGFEKAYSRKNFYSSPLENAVVMMLEISDIGRA
jgi:[ribosomal protein S18]-alanine N-acetyltransferase